mgnify:CR=1 FL=1|tara:strand:+ start:6137 stop:7252 length:1116 start_codon:yes stop_codon:yes gene_type:complete
MKNIPFVNLSEQWKTERKYLLKIIDKTLSSGFWIGGNEIVKLEKKLSKICETKYTAALNSGTDALVLAMHVLGISHNDEVITTPNSFVASTASIIHLGAKPVFVDVLDNQNINPELIEKKINKNTKAIMAVHLTGRVCEMDKICKIAKKHNLFVIEDAAQSISSKYLKKKAGSWGDIACFSTHPLKNLNATGDGGFVTTNSKKLYGKIIELRNHGMTKSRNQIYDFSYVSRMDSIQAAILNFRIKNLNKIIKQRRENAKNYMKYLNTDNIFIPSETKNEFNTYHTFVVQVDYRSELIKFLKKNNISTSIHYPVPIHKFGAYKRRFNQQKESYPVTEIQSKRILSLPINQTIGHTEIKYISETINKFYKDYK